MPPDFRIGHGYDLHRLQPGGRLVLGGVVVSNDVSPVAHSDGDVVIHALVDALLGACALGDIGERFPNTDPAWRGADSLVFLRNVLVEVSDSLNYGVGNVDVTIVAERPKLKPFKQQMREILSRELQIDTGRVNIKAGTNEGCDAIGRAEAVAAHVVVLLYRQV